MRLVTGIFDRMRFLTLACAGLTTVGCSGTSPAANPNPYGTFDATADDASASATPDGDSAEASPAVDAGLDATTADVASSDAAAEGASMEADAGVDATAAGGPGIDAGVDATSGADASAGIDAGSDAAVDAGQPDAGHPTFTSIYNDIIVPSCFECHGEPPPIESNLEMRTQQEAYGNLVGVVAMGDACSVGPPDGGPLPIRVIPGDAADSLLYLKITNTQKCGSGMPLDADSLTADQILAIKTWIDQGAENN